MEYNRGKYTRTTTLARKQYSVRPWQAENIIMKEYYTVFNVYTTNYLLTSRKQQI